MDHSDHVIKMSKNYFKERAPARCNIPFRAINRVEDYYDATPPSFTEELKNLECQHRVPHRSLYGEAQNIYTQSHSGLLNAARSNGVF